MTSWLKLFRKPEGTAQTAKDRLHVIVARERTACGDGVSGYLPQLQQELLQVVAKYDKVDLDRVNVNLDKRGDAEVLELSIMLPDAEQKKPSSIRTTRIAFA